VQRPLQAHDGLAIGAIAALNRLAGNRSLDRLIRGRAWIALIAFALIGIVTLQLLVLRLNANIGRALVSEAQFQRENAALSIENSELASGERVESLAARLGMQLVPEGSLRFLASHPGADIARAAAVLSAPARADAASSSPASSPAAESGSGSATEASSGTSGESNEATAAQATSASTPASGEVGTSSTAETPTAAGAGASAGGEAASAASPAGAPAPTATEAAAGGAQAAAAAGGAG
jgi:cell division protein FtsL